MNYFNQLSKLDDFIKKDEKKEETDNKCNYCSEHNTMVYDYRLSIEICNSCGIINDKIIENFIHMKSTTDVDYGMPVNPLLPKSSMGTYIANTHGGKFKNLQRIHNWNQISSDERGLYEVYKKIDELLYNSNVSQKIINEIKMYYQKISAKDDEIKGFLTRGNIRKSLIAACIYIGCKNNNNPINKKYLAELCEIKETDITKGLKKFSELEKNKNILINRENNIHDYINKYCDALELPEEMRKLIHLIAIRAQKLRIITNNNINSICGGLFYFFINKYNLKIKKKVLLKSINISEVTLNKIFKIYKIHEKILFIGLED